MTTTIITKTKTSSDLKTDIERLLAPFGKVGNFIKPNDKVLIKPNLNTADPCPASSAADFMESVIEIVKSANPARIIIGDSCTMLQNTAKVMECLNFLRSGQALRSRNRQF
jgi:uncharacterized protein (DUF362 family)